MSEHFPDHELACSCCGLVKVHADLRPALEILREEAGNVPVDVNCACRCKKQNAEVGGAPKSEHLADEERECRAADIRIAGMPLSSLYFLACKVDRFLSGGIGIYPDQGFLHVDVRVGRSRWGQIGSEKTSFERAWAHLLEIEAQRGRVPQGG